MKSERCGAGSGEDCVGGARCGAAGGLLVGKGGKHGGAAAGHAHEARVQKTEALDQLADLGHQGNGRGFQIVVGECLRYLNFWGRWIMIATLAGDFTNVDLRSMYVRRTRLIGTTLRSRTSEQKADILACMVRDIWPMLEKKQIRPAIYRVFPIQEAEQAQAVMASGKHVGKIVLKVRG